jgi:hypothetical protein
MKGLIVSIIALFLCFSFARAEESETGKILGGQHQLGYSGVLSTVIVPDLTNSVIVNPKAYFLFIKSRDNLDVVFSWKINNEYVVSRMPITKVRVRYDEEVEKPYVIFRWKPANVTYIDQIMSEQVIYVVFVCKSEVWNPSSVSTGIPVEKPLELEKKDK